MYIFKYLLDMTITIKDKYIIDKQIGEGSFGKIFQAVHKITGEKVAIKINFHENEKTILKNEARIYTILGDIKGVPKMRNFGMDGSYNFMVMDILGPSLLDLKNDYGNTLHKENTLRKENTLHKENTLNKETLSLKTVLSLGLQMLRRIESIHDKGFIHRDIKPDNFLFGSERYPHVLYIIDFGLTKKYCKFIDIDNAASSHDIGHISCETGRPITGTERYVSVNVHDGLTPSRRDDMESIGYIMIYLSGGYLPWSVKENDSGSKNDTSSLPDVRNMKRGIGHWILDNNLPTEYITYIEYCRNLTFDERPDYNYLRTLLLNLFKQKQFTIDNHFEWNTRENGNHAANDISVKLA